MQIPTPSPITLETDDIHQPIRFTVKTDIGSVQGSMVPSRALGEYDRFDGSISIESVLGIPIGNLWVQLKRMEPGHDDTLV